MAKSKMNLSMMKEKPRDMNLKKMSDMKDKKKVKAMIDKMFGGKK